jgi:hypothetical protein
MKKLLLTSFIIALAVSGSYAQNPVPNPGFENWTGGNPDNWFTNSFSPGGECVVQSADAHSGSSSARGEVINVGGTYPPLLVSNSTFGFPVSQDFTTLEFWYKFHTDSGDVLEAIASIYDAAQNPIGGGFGSYTQANTYTHASIPILYSGSGAAYCHLYFSIAGSAGNAHIGSYFLVDDVALTNNPVFVGENESVKKSISVFPNPTAGQTMLNYSLKISSSVTVDVFDLQGRKVSNSNYGYMNAGKHEVPIDLSEFSEGQYFCFLKTEEGMAASIIRVIR